MLVRHFCPHYSQVELPKKSVSGQPNNGCGSWGIKIWNQRRGFTLMGMSVLMFLHIKRSLLNVCQWTMGLAGMSVYISIVMLCATYRVSKTKSGTMTNSGPKYFVYCFFL